LDSQNGQPKQVTSLRQIFEYMLNIYCIYTFNRHYTIQQLPSATWVDFPVVRVDLYCRANMDDGSSYLCFTNVGGT